MYIKNIPLFDTNINSNTFIDKSIMLNTKIDISEIENKLNKILDKFNEKIKYYIHCDESFYDISFNVGFQQYQAMIETSITINIYKNDINKAIIVISKKIDEHPEWADVKKELFKKLM